MAKWQCRARDSRSIDGILPGNNPCGLPGCSWALACETHPRKLHPCLQLKCIDWRSIWHLRYGAGRVGSSTRKKQVAKLVSALEANLILEVKMRIFCRRALGVVFDRLENRRVSKTRRSLIDGSGSSFRTHHLDVVELRIRNFVGCHPRFLTFKDKPFRMRTLWTLDHRFHCDAACEWVHDCMFLSKECGPVKDVMATKNAWCGNIVATTARVRHSKEITNSASKLSSLCTSAYNTSIAMSTFARAPNCILRAGWPRWIWSLPTCHLLRNMRRCASEPTNLWNAPWEALDDEISSIFSFWAEYRQLWVWSCWGCTLGTWEFSGWTY